MFVFSFLPLYVFVYVMSVFSTDDQGMDKTMKCLFDLGYQEMEERRDNDTVLMEVFIQPCYGLR